MEGVRQNRKPYQDGDSAVGDGLAALNHRLDELTRHIEQIARTTTPRRFPAAGYGASADRVAEALARLDRRLDDVINDGLASPASARAAGTPQAAAAHSAGDRTDWTAQIAARQRALDEQALPESGPVQQAGPDLETGEHLDQRGKANPPPNGPIALKPLEDAVTSLRGMMSNLASEGSVVQLTAEVHGLATRFEQVTAGSDSPAIVSLEDRITRLSEKLDSTDGRLGHLGTIEQGMADLLALLEDMRSAGPRQVHARAASLPKVATAEPTEQPAAQAVSPEQLPSAQPNVSSATVLDLISPGTDAALTQARLTAALDASAGSAERAPLSTPLPLTPLDLIPADPADAPTEPRTAAGSSLVPAAPGAVLTATSSAVETPRPPARLSGRPRREPRRPIDPDLPPETPIEPGSGIPRARTSSAMARIAASEAALGGARSAVEAPGGRAAAVAAARSAARAANLEAAAQAEKSGASGSLHLFEWFKKARNAQALPASTPSQAGFEIEPASIPGEPRTATGRTLQRLKNVLVAASVAIIVLGAAQTALDLLLPGESSEPDVTIPRNSPASMWPNPPPIADTNPLAPDENERDTTGAIERDPSLPQPAQPSTPDVPLDDVTGSAGPTRGTAPAATSTPMARPAPTRVPTDEAKTAALHAGVAAEDASAQYEMGSRYAEGRGVPQDLSEAARWFERAAKADFAPAQFRLAGLNEKGEGVKKDVAAARRLYHSAASKGHAKAMHNLAVLHAEGIDGRPDYHAAAQWFRKAAAYGITDSQYNLAILYARGIGLEANLSESYKWFAIAAGRGDHDAAKKRDEVATRLDPQTLMAAKLAVQTFVAEREPDEALGLRTPPEARDRPSAPPTKPRARAGASATR